MLSTTYWKRKRSSVLLLPGNMCTHSLQSMGVVALMTLYLWHTTWADSQHVLLSMYALGLRTDYIPHCSWRVAKHNDCYTCYIAITSRALWHCMHTSFSLPPPYMTSHTTHTTHRRGDASQVPVPVLPPAVGTRTSLLGVKVTCWMLFPGWDQWGVYLCLCMCVCVRFQQHQYENFGIMNGSLTAVWSVDLHSKV